MTNVRPRRNRAARLAGSFGAWLLLIVSVVGTTPVWAQDTTAIVTGTNRLILRRSPSDKSPPFATVAKGAQVEVQRVEGEWAQVVTGRGQVGYVRSNFLTFPNEKAPRTVTLPTAATPSPAASTRPATPTAQPPPVRAAPTPKATTRPTAPSHANTTPTALRSTATMTAPRPTWTARHTPSSTPTFARHTPTPRLHATVPASVKPSPSPTLTATPDLTALHDLEEQNKTLEAEVRRLHEEMALLSDPSQTSLASSMPGAGDAEAQQLRAQLTHLTVAVEELRRRLDASPSSDPMGLTGSAPVEGNPHIVSPGAVLLGIGGLVVGWLVGSAQGRRDERRGRTRIRF